MASHIRKRKGDSDSANTNANKGKNDIIINKYYYICYRL